MLLTLQHQLLKLHDKIKNASFLEDARIKQYLLEKSQVELSFNLQFAVKSRVRCRHASLPLPTAGLRNNDD